jgi:hypothetical protein
MYRFGSQVSGRTADHRQVSKSKIRQSLRQVAGTGRERGPFSSGKPGGSETGGAESGALGAREAEADPELRRVVEAWPALPEGVRADILGLIETTDPSGQAGGRTQAGR